MRDAFKTMPVKTDRKDARGIAELMRLGWFRPVHCKSIAAQETRAILTARKLVQTKLRDVEMSLRGVLRGFGLKVGKTTRATFAGRIRELVAEPSRTCKSSPRRCWRSASAVLGASSRALRSGSDDGAPDAPAGQAADDDDRR